MARLKAIDGWVFRLNGTAIPMPTGTEVTVNKGNSAGLAITDAELNGNNTSTAKYTKIRPHFANCVLSLDTEELQDVFNDACAREDNLIVLENGDATYSIETGALISPQERGTPEINLVTLNTEAFSVVAMEGTIAARTVA